MPTETINNAEQADLKRLIADLDNAIQQAVENPSQLAGSGAIEALQESCLSVARAANEQPPASADRNADRVVRRAELLWQVRTRAGRLQMLIDSATRFYSGCFSPYQPEDLAYGVHGEWKAFENPSHLALEC